MQVIKSVSNAAYLSFFLSLSSYTEVNDDIPGEFLARKYMFCIILSVETTHTLNVLTGRLWIHVEVLGILCERKDFETQRSHLDWDSVRILSSCCDVLKEVSSVKLIELIKSK